MEKLKSYEEFINELSTKIDNEVGGLEEFKKKAKKTKEKIEESDEVLDTDTNERNLDIKKSIEDSNKLSTISNLDSI